MGKPRYVGCMAGLLAVTILRPALAQQPSTADIVRCGKAATALVELKKKGYATAFCVHVSGLFVTNDHVVRGIAPSEAVTLVLDPSLPTQRVLKAKVVRRDAKMDLALLRAEDEKPFRPLELGSVKGLTELAQLIAFGYPFAGLEPIKGKAYPAISVNRGSITSLRRKDGELHRIQIDVTLNPGNSGGPLLDAGGKVTGVVQGGIFATGVNRAIPVSHVRRFLLRPDIRFSVPRIEEADRHKPVTFEAEVVRLVSAEGALEVELTLTGRDGTTRRLPMKHVGKVYRTSAVPFPKPTEAPLLGATVEYARSMISGKVRDRAIKVAGKAVHLHRVRRIEFEGKQQVVLHDGATVDGKVDGLADLPVRVGGQWLTLKDAPGARLIRLDPLGPDEVEYTLAVRSGKERLAERKGRLAVGRADGLSSPGLRPVKLAKTRIERKLPAPITDVIAGGSGRYLLLQMPNLSRVAAFDASLGKVVKMLPIPGEALIAAGRDELIAVLPEHRLIQRWSLATLERETTVRQSFNGVVRAIAMGCASEGPILIQWTESGERARNGHFALLDLPTLRPIVLKEYREDWMGRPRGSARTQVSSFGMSEMSGRVQIWASGTGKVYGLQRAPGGSPRGLVSMVLRTGKLHARYQHTTVGYVAPSLDGQVLCTAQGTYALDLKPKRTALGPCLPSYHPSFVFSVPTVSLRSSSRRLPSRRGDQTPPAVGRGAVFATESAQPLVTLPALTEMRDVGVSRYPSAKMAADKRFHFIPEANLLVTIPPSDDRLVLRQFDLKAELKKSNVRYLIVLSSPPHTAKSGQIYEYQIEVLSAGGGVRYELVAGPERMKVSAAGRVTWRAPRGTEGDRETVSIQITDGGGQKVAHSFTISVR